MEEFKSSHDSIKYNEIKNTIKIWPYLDDLSQTILPYSDRYLSKDVNMVVSVDFSNLKSINSSIGAITLKKLISLVVNSKIKRPYKLILPENERMQSFLQKSGFLYVLDDYYHFVNLYGDLFNNNTITIQKETDIVVDEFLGIRKTHYPIYRLHYNPANGRESVEKFEEWLDDNLLVKIAEKRAVKTDVLFSVLTEMAKNSQDHTENDAFLGVDLIENMATGEGELVFTCSDLGEGIAHKVRMYLAKNQQEDLRPDVWKHGSLTDFYKWAFTLGNTTSKKPNNKGIGMTMIIDGAQELKMDLSFFDAKSMMQIPGSLFYSSNAFNHEELRRKAWNTDNKVGFYYFGRLKF